MPYRYIAILIERPGAGAALAASETAFESAGLRLRMAAGSTLLYAAEDTPTIVAPSGVAIVGHIFRRDGARVGCLEDLPHCNDPAELRTVLLKNFWGEYLLIQANSTPGGELAVTRDPSGGVPCFYSLDWGSGFVTSDVSIAAHAGLYRQSIDWDFIRVCLAYPHGMTAQTALAHVSELLPGCVLHAHGCDARIEQIWSPWRFVEDARRYQDYEAAACHVREAVLSSIQAWAQVDRDILVEVSGGLDSSIIAASLSDTGVHVSCHTLFTPVPGADERHYARPVAEMLGVPLQAHELDFPSARFDAAPPTWSVAPRINVLQHALNESMSVAGGRDSKAAHYSGGGGDVIFCYLGNAAPAADAVREHGYRAGARAIGELAHLHQCTRWKAARLTFNKLVRPAKPPYAADGSLLAGDVAFDGFATHPWFRAPDNAMPGDRERIQHLAGTHLYRHGMWRGPKRHLRLPLLSQPVVEACLNVPAWMWIAHGKNRSVARAAFSDRLPREVLNRKSKGDFAQYLGAVYRRNSHVMRRFLLDGELSARGLLATDEVDAFFKKTLPPRDQSFFRILDLCMVENWIRHQH